MMMMMIRPDLWLTIVLCCIGIYASDESQDISEWIKPGKCKGQWRKDKLIGRCFGFFPYAEYKDGIVKDVSVTTSADCRALCCNLGDKCISWQFFSNSQDSTIKECKITDKIVRLGFEKTGTPDWCDPHPPIKWNGNRLKQRGADGVCEWGEPVPLQCFGLGDEHKETATNLPLDTKACAQACCADKECEVWQESPGRGCYFHSSEGVRCLNNPGIYDGARKCVPGFCDGKENEMLKGRNSE